MKAITLALRHVFGSRNYQLIGMASFIIFFVVNLFTLSTPLTDGAFTAVLFRAMGVTLILRSVLMAILLGLLMPFTVYLLRQRAKAHLGASSVGLVCSGVCCLTGPLCCGAISIMLGWLASLIPAAAAFESHVFSFLGVHEALFFYVSVILLVYALYMNCRRIAANARSLNAAHTENHSAPFDLP